jgi:hypothetical protein
MTAFPVFSFFSLGLNNNVFCFLQMRAIFYFSMAALQDKESQVNGTVVVYYGVGQQKVYSGRPYEYIKTGLAIPFCAVACHYCKDSSVLDSAVQFIYKAFESRILCRARFHMGKP